MTNIKSWWPVSPKPGNMGDIITPKIIKNVFNVNVTWVSLNKECKMLLSTGSIINKARNSNFTVWGSGIMRESDTCSPDARYLSVRGPRTYEILNSKGINIPPIFGDPAILVKEFFNPTDVEKIYDYGIIPHYVDYEKIKKYYRNFEGVNIINVLHANPLVPIKEMLKCKRVISSSLHGIIFAHTYNIPVCWAEFSNKLKGDGVKFHDHYDYVKLKGEKMKLRDKIKLSDFSKLSYTKDPTIDMREMKKAFLKYIRKEA